MHIGGRKATEHLIDLLSIRPGMNLLELGSGIGGPARTIASKKQVHITGIDLTPEYKEIASQLSALVGLTNRNEFLTANATNLPFEAEQFDICYMIHVGMNIFDKLAVYKNTHRVLKQGGVFGIYDIIGEQDKVKEFPMP